MTERLLTAAAILVACAGGYLLLQAYLAIKRRALLATAPSLAASSLDAGLDAGKAADERATLVYFSTAECGRCRDQATAIAVLESRLGEELRVRKVDALAEPELAERYGVLTVPTTIVLDGATRPRAVNYGYASQAKLEAQVRDVLSCEALAA